MEESRSSVFEVRRRAYDSFMRRRGRSDSTLKTFGRFLDAFGSWLGDRDPASVTRLVQVEEYLDEWEADYQAKNGKAPSQNTVRNHQTALASFYDFLFKRELVQANPLAKLDRPKAATKRGDWLSIDEWNALLDEPATRQERIIISLYCWTAARAGDILDGVSQGDVNLNNDTLVIRKSKTVAGERVIPILPELRQEIIEWFRYLREVGLRDDRLPLLVTRHKTAMKHSYAWRVVKRVAARAGVRTREAPDNAGENASTVTLHTLRRTLATHLLNGYNGREPVRAEVVQALLGHSDTRTTLGYYAEVQQATMAAEIRRAVG